MPRFIDFLKTGRIDQVTLDKTPAEVKLILGEPSDISVRKNPEIWKYGPIELTFYRRSKKDPHLLASITCKFAEDTAPPSTSVWTEGWVPSHETNSSTFTSELDRHGIRISKMQGGESELERFELHIELDSSGVVDFRDDRLVSVRFEAEERSELKQMSITLSDSDLRLIKNEARLLGVSSAALCARWITRQVEFLRAAEEVCDTPATHQ